MGLSAAGVWAIKLLRDDAVVGAGKVGNKGYLVVLTEKGYAKRTPTKQFPSQKRYGGGVQAAKLSSRTGKLAVAALAGESDSLMLMAAKGRVTKLPVRAIHALGRAAAGYRSRSDTKETYLDPSKHGPPALLTVLAGTKAAAKRARASAQAKQTTRKPKRVHSSKKSKS
jgi:DNA gyrase subunit A